MGIGAAFASGLVRGFTRNIEMEQQRRLADRQKVDALETLVAEAVMKGGDDVNINGVNQVKDMITSARQTLDSRQPIDLFGRATDGLDLDMSKLSMDLTAATKYNSTLKGNTHSWGFNTKIDSGVNEATRPEYKQSGFENCRRPGFV